MLTWLKKSTENGYHSFIEIEDLQDLINNITYWYEMKYPERELEYYEGTRYYNFEKIEKLSNNMNIKQLLYRLPHYQLCLMECAYRSNVGGIHNIYNKKGEIVGTKTVLFIPIKRKNVKNNHLSMNNKSPILLLYADSNNGQVDIDYNLKEYINEKKITLDELLNIFKEKYNNELEFTKLEECIYDHNCDIELRRRILQLVALKLLYSNQTIPERGYKRAKRFINEFNKKLNLNLNTEEIDKIINYDYTNGEKWEYVKKTYINKNGKKHSYQTMEDISKKEQKTIGKTKRLVKTLLKK